MGSCLAFVSLRETKARRPPFFVQGRTTGLQAAPVVHLKRGDVSQRAVNLTYFPLWAKGPSIALALEHSGLEWEGAFCQFEDWKDMKGTTPFRELPVLEVPDHGMIGHELAILNYIGQQVPAMGGMDVKEFLVSQQLLNQAEDI